MVQPLLQWVCGAGSERAVMLLGAPTSICARCTGFYLALALGLALHRFVRATGVGALPMLALAVAVAVTLAQVASESLGGIVSAPELRLVLGAAVGLPAGWIAGARAGGSVGRMLVLGALISSSIVVLAIALHDPRLLALVVLFDISIALAIATLLVAAFVRARNPAPESPT